MSLLNDNRTHTKKVITITTKVDLILTDQLIAKINTLHKEAPKGIEWSSILLYRTTEGSIQDIPNWKLEAYDLIPMDIGSAGYTEYDFTAEDTYASDIFMDAMMVGNKIGHIHTHHNMNCFFSGTDTSELHDNSPNHSYYLSLIVNYKDPGAWCAKVAFCCTENITGTIHKSYNYIGGVIENVIADEEINNTEEIMYTIDCNIITSALVEATEESFLERITSLNTKRVDNIARTSQVIVGNGGFHNKGTGITGTVGKSWNNPAGGSYNSYTKKKRENKEEREDGIFNQTEISTFLKIWLEGYTEPPASFIRKPLINFIAEFNRKSEEEKTIYLDKIEDQYEDLISSYFDLDKTTQVDAHCISLCILDALLPYIETEFYKRIDSILDLFLTVNVLDAEVERLTGLEFVSDIITEEPNFQQMLFDEYGLPIVGGTHQTFYD